jgi:hypothetical protein
MGSKRRRRAWRDAIAPCGTAAALGDLTKYYFKLWSDVAKANNIRAE